MRHKLVLYFTVWWELTSKQEHGSSLALSEVRVISMIGEKKKSEKSCQFAWQYSLLYTVSVFCWCQVWSVMPCATVFLICQSLPFYWNIKMWLYMSNRPWLFQWNPPPPPPPLFQGYSSIRQLKLKWYFLSSQVHTLYTCQCPIHHLKLCMMVTRVELLPIHISFSDLDQISMPQLRWKDKSKNCILVGSYISLSSNLCYWYLHWLNQ